MYHRAFKTDCRITCYPDPDVVRDCEKRYTDTYTGHLGLDTVPNSGDNKLYVMAAGIVVEMCANGSNYQRATEMTITQRINPTSSGNAVTIKTDKGIEYTYKHMATNPYDVFKLRQVVNEGDSVGIMGATGVVTAAHLHTDVIVSGAYVDPTPYVRGDKQLATGQTNNNAAGGTGTDYKVGDIVIAQGRGYSSEDGKSTATNDYSGQRMEIRKATIGQSWAIHPYGLSKEDSDIIIGFWDKDKISPVSLPSNPGAGISDLDTLKKLIEQLQSEIAQLRATINAAKAVLG